jgi:hypothetical protein
MEVFEITGYQTGVSRSGVNYLEPSDSFQNLEDGFVYRQVLQSRRGISKFAPRLAGNSRIHGIFEHILPDGTKKLLACDVNYLYLYNTGTGIFDQLAFAGSAAAFAISDPKFYVSGTSYPDKNNKGRFIFCSEGMTDIYYYDDTANTVSSFTLDAPDFQNPALGTLTVANFVFRFGERLNFIVPTINGITYSQGMLYSGIRNTAGNGDKFNVAGSGLLQLDTAEAIISSSILGNVFSINADRSNWVVEKTRDAFNPYFSRKIPGVLGTDAPFSAVSYNEKVESMGKTGVIKSDNRETLRVDNRIPNFTENQINQEDFDIIYGGFDRTNNQFLWTYIDNFNGATTQDKVLVHNYDFDSWSVFNLALTVFGQSDIGLSLTWDEIDESMGNDSWAQWDTTEELWDKIGIGASVQKTLAGDNFGFIYQLNQDNDDILTGINTVTVSASPGLPTILGIDAASFSVGDEVCIQNVEGMTELNNYSPDTDQTITSPSIFVTTVTDINTIEINVDSTNFSAYTPGTGTISKLIQFKGEIVPFNPYRSQGLRCYIGYVEFLLEKDSFLYVDVIQNQDNDPFISNVLLQPDSLQNAAQWVSMSVNNEAEFMTFRLRMSSPATQFRMTSMRIHAKPGGKTSY